MNAASKPARPILIAAALVLAVLASASCSPDRASLAPEDVLQILSDIPEVPYPTVTAENAAAPGLVAVIGYCDMIASLRIQMPAVAQDIRDAEAPAINERNVYAWNWRSVSHVGKVCDLNAVVADSVWFEFSRAGGSTETDAMWTGWTRPASGTGRYDLGTGTWLEWSILPEGPAVGCTMTGMVVTATVPAGGGGSLACKDVGTGATIFTASWDGQGHGSSSMGDW